MKFQAPVTALRETVGADLAGVSRLVVDSLKATSLRPVVDDLQSSVAGGKMLRARMALRLGLALGAPAALRLRVAAAVEMTHAASLLHDDVLDHAHLRRGAAAFWVSRGVSGSILLGDLIVARAFALLCELRDFSLVEEFSQSLEAMCDAECQQEILLRNQKPDWDICIDIARRKTGALFAFAAQGCAGQGQDGQLRKALREAGYAVGTAYQLSDDLLDAFGDPMTAGKTLGNDAASAKITAATAWKACAGNPRVCVGQLCRSAEDLLVPWPAVHEAWKVFMEEEMSPEMSKCLERVPAEMVT